MFQIVIADFIVAVVIGFFVFMLLSLFGSLRVDRKKRKMKDRLNNAVATSVEILTPSLDALVALYINIVSKHGSGSEEAEAFKFGLDSKLVKEVHKDSVDAFFRTIAIVDKTWKQMAKKK